MLEILIIRHGQSIADIGARHEGRADYPLTELGIKQAKLLADWLVNNYSPEIILSSPLKRASQTAEILGKQLGIKIQYYDELMEWNNGVLAGLTFEEAKIKYPTPKGGRKLHEKILNAESWIDLRARGQIFWSKFLNEFSECKNKRIAIVSHGKMINMLFRSFISLPVDTDIWARNSDTGVHLWKIENGKRYIIFMNKCEHLLGKHKTKTEQK